MYTVIITTKNNAPTVRHVLSSTLILTDEYDVELIMVDGNSRDDTPKILGDFAEKHRGYFISVKILRDPGISSSYARHLGFKNSLGDVLIYLDGDTPLSSSFKYHLERELEDSDLISPIHECVPIDEATRVFNLFMKTVSYIQTETTTIVGKVAIDPSILPPARIFKRRVLERMKGYPLSSRFFGEDRIATAIAVRLGFRYKFSTLLKLFKIDESGYYSYWKKHYRYAIGIHKDLSLLGKNILRGYIIMRRLNHINVLFPLLSLLYAGRSLAVSRNIRNAAEVLLMKYLIDFAMFTGDLKGFIHGDK
jgi:glycosyltransferase involved in cell wall biosynthesis